MKALRWLALALVVAACGEQVPATAPSTTPAPRGPDASLVGDLLGATGLLKCSQLPADTETATIGPSGGTLTVGPHRLFIPAGALSAPVTITGAIRQGGNVNGVHFEPEGLEFERSAYLTMSYANCNLLGRLAPKRIAYVNNALDILYYLLSIDNLWTKKVTGRIDHFSDYVVAW